LADYDYQKRVWLCGSGPEMSSLTEAVCGLFDDSGLGDALDKGQSVYSVEVDTLLRRILNMTSALDPDQRVAVFSPKMDIMRNLAASALKLLQEDKQK
jgi:hypothetical protein